MPRVSDLGLPSGFRILGVGDLAGCRGVSGLKGSRGFQDFFFWRGGGTGFRILGMGFGV